MIIYLLQIKKLIFYIIFILFYINYCNAFDLNNISNPTVVPKIHANTYILIDFHSNKVLAEMNADVQHYPASLVKIMTSYIIGQAIESGRISTEDIVLIEEEAWAIHNPILKGSSLMFLKHGDLVSVDQLNKGIILQSGNDACIAIANYIAGNQNIFVNMMNEYAKVLNLKNTFFKNVHGLDSPGQFSSARDMALLGRALIKDLPNQYAIYKEKEFTYNRIRQINRNRLLWDNNINVDGIKTGHTNLSGYNLVASATKEEMRLISVILGSSSLKECENDTKNLLKWGFRSFKTLMPIESDKEITSQPVWFGDVKKVKLGSDKNIHFTIPYYRIKDFNIQFSLEEKKLCAPLKKYQKVGIISLCLNEEVIEKYPLVVLNEIKFGSFMSRFLDYILYFLYNWLN
ncbi:serine hydrolase [Candidatus Schneideria nysicola]|uniref:serine hydrolase n=1 Tax=Candidatus Schneideria nysicola TaxID=1081631 RepID=UPI001CAA4BB7|nr:serine hydrolase [Candidatus Schneideria nysicola]UAJ66025.1 serine hydrolase [Candidatus Schneideria nysicola]